MSIAQPDQAEALSEQPNIRPIWAEFKFVTAKYGLGRGKIYELLKSGQIVVKELTTYDEQGNPRSRGRLLVNLESLDDYLESLPDKRF